MLKIGGHPQRGRGGVKPNAYDCLQGGRGGFKVVYVRKKKILHHKSQNFLFFVQKKLLHWHLSLCIEKSVRLRLRGGGLILAIFVRTYYVDCP